ncbi:hypothetical protein MLD38_013353 [Melastoma candidum]|uniref:Uncharacterized protein n=1 Tax=Melastoma candidum TaxID=119954 RepID=A0ACB9RB55_9MYRT|nr:hypothetical protein MLD38_013353 [Melastoma candidum]
MDCQMEGPADYVHISQNEFIHRKHKKQKEEDIAICNCKFDVSDSESSCGEQCLNVLTSTECTTPYCPCGAYCNNQKFQRCQYARTKLFKTDGRGFGLLADENIKAGQFIIEYCGEVISWREAKRRSQAYEKQGLKDAFIIYLNAAESIDATRNGSLARFINHSCQPNCETRKWNVLGEIRVGIFAKLDIPSGSELSYDYNFEWYGGAKVRCLCGAPSCSGFLGAKSRGFQEDTYLWDDDDDRYSIDKIPLYDSEEDIPSTMLQKAFDLSYLANGQLVVFSEQMANAIKDEMVDEKTLGSEDPQKDLCPTSAVTSRTASGKNQLAVVGRISKKKSMLISGFKTKRTSNHNDAEMVARLLAPVHAEELLKKEEMRKEAASQLDALYNDIRPTIEEHEKDNQDSMATVVAEKWIEASCWKNKAEFNLYHSLIKHVAFSPRRPQQSKDVDNNEEKTSSRSAEMMLVGGLNHLSDHEVTTYGSMFNPVLLCSKYQFPTRSVPLTRIVASRMGRSHG